MVIGAQFQTKSGNIYIADVIEQKIMRITKDGKKSAWRKYDHLDGGYVGQQLKIYWPGKAEPMITTEIEKLEFPKIGD